MTSFYKYLVNAAHDQDLAYFVGMRGYVFGPDHKFPKASLFGIHNNKKYTSDDLQAAKEMLERFSYLIMFEGLSWMGPYMMQHRLHWQVTNTTEHRKGSRKVESVFDHIAHDPVIINQAVETAGMSLHLYAHGEALACLDYYLLSSGKENSTFRPSVREFASTLKAAADAGASNVTSSSSRNKSSNGNKGKGRGAAGGKNRIVRVPETAEVPKKIPRPQHDRINDNEK